MAVIKVKDKGRSYSYTGQDLIDSIWYIIDDDGTRYEDQIEYEAALVAKKTKTARKKRTTRQVKKED